MLWPGFKKTFRLSADFQGLQTLHSWWPEKMGSRKWGQLYFLQYLYIACPQKRRPLLQRTYKKKNV